MLPISLAMSPDLLAGPVHVMAAGVLIHHWELILALPAAWAMPQLGHTLGEGKGGWADLNPLGCPYVWLVAVV